MLYLKTRVEGRELELVELDWLVTHHWLTISNLVNKPTYINGSHCSRFGDGNHTIVSSNVVVVTISNTTWIHAHLWVGVMGGTFGEIILVIGSKCITTSWFIGTHLIIGDICVLTIGGLILWMICSIVTSCTSPSTSSCKSSWVLEFFVNWIFFGYALEL